MRNINSATLKSVGRDRLVVSAGQTSDVSSADGNVDVSRAASNVGNNVDVPSGPYTSGNVLERDANGVGVTSAD
ncbi:uncharacterized protein IUM83_19926 [Phytophthora cinnamomi]|uniref:uncharacterized protein n=1 Tax=Phytophthora cinnamomi TaxID=4785 RepID=UPI00355A2BC6|nr:hypothetical protein IUM83_19926 [Phytophthora cinnamomi]